MVQFLVATLGTLSFAVLFQAPRRHYLFCGLVGGFSWFAYLLMMRLCGVEALACFAAALTLTLLARLASVLRQAPVVVFLIAGIFPLVPGAGIYYTAYYLFSGQVDLATAKGLETMIISGSIAMGILFGFTFPQWCFDRMFSRFHGKKAR